MGTAPSCSLGPYHVMSQTLGRRAGWSFSPTTSKLL